MESASHASDLKRLSVHSLLRKASSIGSRPVSGYIFQMQSRKAAGPQSIEEPYFSVHWAILQDGKLYLFDSSISQSCSHSICLTGSRLDAALHQQTLWPPWCSQLFTLVDACGASWQFGCSKSDDWHRELAAAALAPAAAAAASVAAEAAAVAARMAAEPAAEPEAGGENPYDTIGPQPEKPPLPEELRPQPQEQPQGAIYDRCDTQLQDQSLHSLASAGRTASFSLDYVAAAVYTGDDVDDGTLWSILEDSDKGTFLLTGFNQKQASQPLQVVLKTAGFEVKSLPMMLTDENKITLLTDSKTFSSIEELIFHYHLFPITVCQDGIGVCLTCAHGYDKAKGLPIKTLLFSTCLWTLGDKDLCSKVLFESAVGTYSLRKASQGGNFVLSILSQGVVAKLTISVETSVGKTEFFLTSSGMSHSRFSSLEDLLLQLHRAKFPLIMAKSRVEMTLQTPFLMSPICRAKLQSLVLEPLRQRMFHRGLERQAEAALKLPATPAGAFIVWLCSATEVVLMALSGAQRVEKFRIVCEATGCTILPQRQFYLANREAPRFDSVEALIAHLQWNSGLLLPELSCSLQQPVSRRS